MPKFFERNKIFLALFIAGLLISGAIRSLNRSADAPRLRNSVAQSATSSGKIESEESPTDLYKVVRVVDGDTITVNVSGKIETVRLLGINAPEIVGKSKTAECLGKLASDRAKEVLTDDSVKLEADESQGERDKYGRLLRYVFLEDGTNFNEMMITEGFANEYTYKLPYKYQSEFRQAEKEANEAKRGLWSPDVCD